jgi:hypothetical protein
MVREGTWVGWIEETQRKTSGCDLKERSDGNHVALLSQTSRPLLCFCAVLCLCLIGGILKTPEGGPRIKPPECFLYPIINAVDYFNSDD